MRNLLAGIAACLMITAASAQTIHLNGRITNEANKPLAGASVAVKKTQNGTTSDANGNYRITISYGDTVVFSFIGYETQQHRARGTMLNVKMKPLSDPLDEVVVVGYGTQKSETTGAAQQEVKKLTPLVVAADQEVREARPLQAQKVSRMVVEESMAYTSADISLPPAPAPGQGAYYPGGEEYAQIKENRFTSVSKDPLSTFALEVDGASYSNARRVINQGMKPEPDAVRVEEFLNYFSYDYPQPQGKEPLRISFEVGPCAWNTNHKLVKIGVKAREVASEKLPPANLVFLIDVSGSMNGANRLPLVKQSLKLLINNLRDEDRVAIVTYAGAAGLALPSTPGSDRQKIRETLDRLAAGGSTAGGAGIQLAYKVARDNFRTGGNNRIILCTDGDFNVGVSSAEGLESLIERERKDGTFLTVLGYGMGNYKDKKIQVLAEKGNGNYAYIDNIQEANRVLVNEFGGTMYTVAKDVKLQVEFNPEKVQSFRLVGYESRLLAHEDFNDDTKDAGEIGAGHTVTALYEIVPTGLSGGPGSIDPLKYQSAAERRTPLSGNGYPDLMTVKWRWKAPDGEKSQKGEMAVIEQPGKALSEDFYFASAVAMFGQLLRGSDFKGDATYDRVIETARKGLGKDDYGYRREFIRLAESVKGMGDDR